MERRIKELRSELGLSQEEFANKVGLTKNYISLVETGKRELATRTAKSICRIFYVNEDWLVSGNGEMFLEKSKESLLTDFFSDVLKPDSGFKKRLVSALAELDDDGWSNLEKFIDSIAEK